MIEALFLKIQGVGNFSLDFFCKNQEQSKLDVVVYVLKTLQKYGIDGI